MTDRVSMSWSGVATLSLEMSTYGSSHVLGLGLGVLILVWRGLIMMRFLLKRRPVPSHLIEYDRGSGPVPVITPGDHDLLAGSWW